MIFLQCLYGHVYLVDLGQVLSCSWFLIQEIEIKDSDVWKGGKESRREGQNTLQLHSWSCECRHPRPYYCLGLHFMGFKRRSTFGSSLLTDRFGNLSVAWVPLILYLILIICMTNLFKIVSRKVSIKFYIVLRLFFRMWLNSNDNKRLLRGLTYFHSLK